ncbi:MAG: hypothetical protein ACLQM6_14185 [Acidobacteriaceae bacterium]
MTANPANYPATVTSRVPYHQYLDPVRARVTASHQLTNDQMIQAYEAAHHAADDVHLPPGARGSGPCGPHPGDVLYWITCLGGACLLLIEVTN